MKRNIFVVAILMMGCSDSCAGEISSPGNDSGLHVQDSGYGFDADQNRDADVVDSGLDSSFEVVDASDKEDSGHLELPSDSGTDSSVDSGLDAGSDCDEDIDEDCDEDVDEHCNGSRHSHRPRR